METQHIAHGLEGVGLAQAGAHGAEKVEGLLVLLHGPRVVVLETQHIAHGLEGVGLQVSIFYAQAKGLGQPDPPGVPAVVHVA